MDSDGEEIEVDPNTKDGTINISSSILYPDTGKSGKSVKLSNSRSKSLRNSVVGRLFLGFKKTTQAKKPMQNGSDYLKKHNNKLRSNFIVRHLDSWRVNWDLFIIILAIYNAIQLPMDIAFALPIFQTPTWRLIDNLIDLSFVMDIAISFRTTF